MKPPMPALRLAAMLGSVGVLGACGGPSNVGPPATTTGAPSASDAGAETVAPVVHPFAGTPLEAQSLIQGQIDAHMKTLWTCVGDYRTRQGDPHRAVVVDIGIDQEGTLLGVMGPNPKQELDPPLRDCVFGTLRGLPFPRSHSGVITVRQTFTDAAISR